MKLTDRMLTRMDIDPGQWRTLVRMTFKLLGRNKSAITYRTKSKGRIASKGLWLGFIIYGIMGIMLAVAVATAKSAGIASFFLLNVILPLIAMSMLLEFVTIIVYPEDISILGYRPISSRTYFAAKASTVIMGILSYAASLGGPSVIAFLFKFGIRSAIAWIFTTVCGSLSVAMLMIIIYSMLVRHVRPENVRNIMGYTQLLFSFVAYGGYVLLPGLGHKYIASAATPGAWTITLPTSWYASVVAIAAGEFTSINLFEASLAVIFTVILAWIIVDRISLVYSETVAGAAIQSSGPDTIAKPGRSGFHLFRRPEDRAVAMLIARQFRYDVKFKMAVLSILPLTVMYIFMGLQEGKSLIDPFSVNFKMSGSGPSMFLYFAMILFPVTIRGAIIHNDMYEASWIFFATPIDRGRVMLSAYRILVRTFVLPYLAVIALIFLWFFRNPMHVLMHMAVLFLSCEIFLLILFLYKPALPFSMPRETGDNVTGILVVMLVGSVFFIGLIAIFMNFLYLTLKAYLIGVGSLLAISVFLKVVLEKRLKTRGRQLEFVG
jgi:ABC-2 type transport system permease protein